MILYNVTISIDESASSEWLEWMKNVHIPEVMATGKFTSNKILRVHGEEEGGITFAIQYLAPNMEAFQEYQKEFAPTLQKAHTERYNGKFAAFRTVLEVIHVHES